MESNWTTFFSEEHMKITKIDTDKSTLSLQFTSSPTGAGTAAGDARNIATALERLLCSRNPGLGATHIDAIENLIKAINVIGDNAS
jgi:hypothetical protein